AETTLPACVRPQRTQGVDVPEVRPVDVTEVELRVRRLPQQETGETLLAAGTDDQVRVGLTLGVKVLGDVVDVENVGKLFDGAAGRRVLMQEGTNRIGDFAPTSIADSHVYRHAVAIKCRGLGRLERGGCRRRQHVQRADRLQLPRVARCGE